MKTKYMAAALALGFLACTAPREAEPTGTTVTSAKAELGTTLHGTVTQTRAVNAADPTLTPTADRTAHKLTIKIGESSGLYAFSSGSWAINGVGVKFPDNAAADVALTLAPEVENPVNKQDGTADKLIDADILVGSLTAQAPVNELPAVVMTHANTLLDFTIDGLTASVLDTYTITINEVITPYRVAGATKMQAIVEPGGNVANIFLGVGTDKFTALVGPAGGTFQPNTRYTFKIILESAGIRIENVAVSQWDEKAPGSGTAVLD